MIDVDNLCMRQGEFQLADVSLHVSKGRYAILMGTTGCGKTTILEAIAGLRTIAAGRIVLNGVERTHATPAERNLGYVPQDGALFRTMSVRDNLGFALSIRGQPADAIKQRVDELAAWLQVGHILERRAVGLSGGETQRIALGRALANRPPILLMDEPLSSLDEPTRDRMVELLRGLPGRESVTVLHVTHSQREADALGDWIFRLHEGRIEVVKSGDPV
ncbi:MAG: ABC transporter ATP-binding protein [Planctomycetes bacterium]|nr:ABC transporter ATP-binding protein [Planctomycetota bacterium]